MNCRSSDTSAEGAATNNRNKGVMFKNQAPFNNCIDQINNREVDDTHDIDEVMPMCNLLEYRNIDSKTSGSLWKYQINEPV